RDRPHRRAAPPARVERPAADLVERGRAPGAHRPLPGADHARPLLRRALVAARPRRADRARRRARGRGLPDRRRPAALQERGPRRNGDQALTSTLETQLDQDPWSADEFVAALRAQGARYHNLHPFHQRMNSGELSREELQRWVANRYYYQIVIPIKDAAILSN